MTPSILSREQAEQRLRSVEAKIRSLGVRLLALFGSVLRNDARHDSDVDLLVEFYPEQKTFDRFLPEADFLIELCGNLSQPNSDTFGGTAPSQDGA